MKYTVENVKEISSALDGMLMKLLHSHSKEKIFYFLFFFIQNWLSYKLKCLSNVDFHWIPKSTYTYVQKLLMKMYWNTV